MKTVPFEVIHASREKIPGENVTEKWSDLIVLQTSFEFIDSMHAGYHGLEKYKYTITLSTDMQYLIDLINFNAPYEFDSFVQYEMLMAFEKTKFTRSLSSGLNKINPSRIFEAGSSYINYSVGKIGRTLANDYPKKAAYIKDSLGMNAFKNLFYEKNYPINHAQTSNNWYALDKFCKYIQDSDISNAFVLHLGVTHKESSIGTISQNYNQYQYFDVLLQLEQVQDYDPSTIKLNIEDCFTWKDKSRIESSKFDQFGFNINFSFPDSIELTTVEEALEIKYKYTDWNHYNLFQGWFLDDGSKNIQFLLQNSTQNGTYEKSYPTCNVGMESLPKFHFQGVKTSLFS